MSNPIPGTGIAVVTDRLWSLRVFYQLLNGRLEQSKHLDGVWTNEALTFSPVDDTPLAAITYNSGKEVSKTPLRLSHTQLDGDLGRFAYTTLTPTTLSRSIATPKAKTGIKERSAIRRPRPSPPLVSQPLYLVLTCSALVKRVFTFVFTIRVSITYFTYAANLLKHLAEPDTEIVAELANDGSWYDGALQIPDALGATDLAAVAYYFQDQTQIRVYYQARDLSLREYGWNKGGWFKGRLISRFNLSCVVLIGTFQRRIQPWTTNGSHSSQCCRLRKRRAPSLLP